MMAVWVTSGALLLVLMTGASYSYPMKQGFDPSSSLSSSYAANPASTGSKWDVLSSGSAPAAPRLYLGTGPLGEPGYPQPSLQRDPAASYGSNSFAAPAGYASGSNAGSTYPSSFQPAYSEVAPQSPFSGEETSARPGAHHSMSSSGPSYVSPPGPPQPQFQAGDLSKWAQIYEFGNSESETEDQGFQPPPPGFQELPVASRSEPQILTPVRSWYGYPYYYDYMFLTGQYPPGTVSHYSSNYEQGHDNSQDTHYIRDYFPAYPSAEPVDAKPAVSHAPLPVKQSIGSTSYGKGGEMPGHNQPTGAAGPQGSYFQASAFEQPGQSPGGHGLRKVGY